LGGKQVREEIELKPVRQMQIYVLPHSHHDLGYTDLQADVEAKQIRNITRGIELARKTKDYPEGARFVWNLEVLWGADLYMKRGSKGDRRELIDAVQKGWIGINGSYANELTGLCRPEELLQLFHYSGQLGKTCGVKVDSAMMSDVPGFSWGTVTAMSQAGIRYFRLRPTTSIASGHSWCPGRISPSGGSRHQAKVRFSSGSPGRVCPPSRYEARF
jgi:hypothetical protein